MRITKLFSKLRLVKNWQSKLSVQLGVALIEFMKKKKNSILLFSRIPNIRSKIFAGYPAKSVSAATLLLTYIEPVLRVQLGVVMFAVADESFIVAWYTVPNPDFIAVFPRCPDKKNVLQGLTFPHTISSFSSAFPPSF